MDELPSRKGRPRGVRNKPKTGELGDRDKPVRSKAAPSQPPALATKRGTPLTPLQRELILQVFFTVGTIAGTARKCGCAIGTVQRVVDAAQKDPSLMAGRARALDQLAGRVHCVAEQVIDSIRPEELETSYDAKTGPLGNFTGWSIKGPSLKDKAFAVSVLSDKLRILQAARTELLDPRGMGMDESQRIMMFPASVAEARHLIAQKVKRLRIMDVEFHVGDETTNQRVSELANKARVSEEDISEASVVSIDPVSVFDG